MLSPVWGKSFGKVLGVVLSNLNICSVKSIGNYDYLYALLGRLGSLGLHATIQKEADFSPTWLGPPGPHMY